MEYIRQETMGHIKAGDLIATPDEGVRLAQGRFLDELPGAAFAAITLVWVVSSFAGLMWHELPADTIAHIQNLVHALAGSHVLTMASRLGGAASFAKTVCGFYDPRTPA